RRRSRRSGRRTLGETRSSRLHARGSVTRRQDWAFVSHYSDEDPRVQSRRAAFTLRVGERELTLDTDRGVFARGELDAGTAVLLKKAPMPANGTVLDLGAGYGPIALAIAASAPDCSVYAVDVNERALVLVRDNAAANGLGNVHACRPEEVP